METFVLSSKKPRRVAVAIRYPRIVRFYNTLTKHDYFQHGVQCELKDPWKVVFPYGKSFYVEHHGVFTRMTSDVKLPMSRQQLACRLLNFVHNTNVYKNYRAKVDEGLDVSNYGPWNLADNLSVHSLNKSKRVRDKLPVYTMKISS